MSWIASSAHCLEAKGRDFSVEALAEVLPQHWIADALESCGVATKRRRKLSCGMTVWLTILLALFRRYSYVNLLEMLRGGFCTPDRWSGSAPPCSSALSKARDRVGIAPLEHLYQRSAASWIECGGSLWFHGQRVVAIDGFTLKTWDSDENRAHFGVPGSSRGTTAFPQLRVVGCVDVGTRVMESMRYSPYSTGELTLANSLRADLQPGSLLLLDRGFVSYGLLWDLVGQQVGFIARITRTMKVARLSELGPGDALVSVTFPRKLRRDRPDLPKDWVLREVTRLDDDGNLMRLLTTLTDPSIDSSEIIALYGLRWEEETAIDEIKTHLGEMATVNSPLMLRSRRPHRVEQELYAILIAYNALRRLMVDAAATDESATLTPLRISFTATLLRLTEVIRDMMQTSAHRLAERYEAFLRAVARARVPERPGRSFPRAVRIKMSKYPRNRRRFVA